MLRSSFALAIWPMSLQEKPLDSVDTLLDMSISPATEDEYGIASNAVTVSKPDLVEPVCALSTPNLLSHFPPKNSIVGRGAPPPPSPHKVHYPPESAAITVLAFLASVIEQLVPVVERRAYGLLSFAYIGVLKDRGELAFLVRTVDIGVRARDAQRSDIFFTANTPTFSSTASFVPITILAASGLTSLWPEYIATLLSPTSAASIPFTHGATDHATPRNRSPGSENILPYQSICGLVDHNPGRQWRRACRISYPGGELPHLKTTQ
jgi:hypothetical protein